jgi:hypothetical protein
MKTNEKQKRKRRRDGVGRIHLKYLLELVSPKCCSTPNNFLENCLYLLSSLLYFSIFLKKDLVWFLNLIL